MAFFFPKRTVYFAICLLGILGEGFEALLDTGLRDIAKDSVYKEAVGFLKAKMNSLGYCQCFERLRMTKVRSKELSHGVMMIHMTIFDTIIK